MSQKIPFLQMFAALRRWTELSNAVEGWLKARLGLDISPEKSKIVNLKEKYSEFLRKLQEQVEHLGVA